MSAEDKIGKMMSRVDLVGEVEEYEELLENLKSHYSAEEVNYVIKVISNENEINLGSTNPHILLNSQHDQTKVISDFSQMRISCFLKDVCNSIKLKIQKDQDLEASMMSELEFKNQTETIDRLEELETIIVKNLPMLSQSEIIQSLQQICNQLCIKMDVKQHTESIKQKAKKRYKVVKQKVEEVKNEIDKVEHFIRENVNTVENFISKPPPT